MMRLMYLTILLIAALPAFSVRNDTYTVTGKVSCEGKGVKNVVISDGVEVVRTGSNGRYRMNSMKENGYVFISVPSGYDVGRDGIIPRHFVRLKGNKIDTADFYLRKSSQDKFRFIAAADIHLTGDKADNDLEQFHNTLYPDISKTADSSETKTWALFLGDMSTDGKWHINSFGLKEYLEQMSGFPAPVYHIMGNHDNEPKAQGKIADWDTYAESVYKNIIGPNYYSFNIGKLHFLMLDNIVAYGNAPDNRQRKSFDFGRGVCFNYFIDSLQVEWMKKDLAFVDHDTPLIVSMHVPFRMIDSIRQDGYAVPKNVGKHQNHDEILSILEKYDNVHFLYGHNHLTQTFETEEGRTYHLIASASAVSWKLHDNDAPLVCSDGTPGGYQIFEVDGKDISWQFKSSKSSIEDSQMYVYDLNKVPAGYGGEPDSNKILINIFNWDSSWTVKVYEDGHEIPSSNIRGTDPLYRKVRSETQLLNHRPTAFLPSKTFHMFIAERSSNNSEITVRVTDRFGNMYTAGINQIL